MNSKGTYARQIGPTCFKEGLRTSKRAYVLQRGPSYAISGPSDHVVMGFN